MYINYVFAIFFICFFFSIVYLIFIYSKHPRKRKTNQYVLNKTILVDLKSTSGSDTKYSGEEKEEAEPNITNVSNSIKSNKNPKVMRTIVKIVLTFVAIVIATFLIGALKSATGSDSTGVLGLVIGAALLGAIIAIWKYNAKPDTDDKTDNHQLDKS